MCLVGADSLEKGRIEQKSLTNRVEEGEDASKRSQPAAPPRPRSVASAGRKAFASPAKRTKRGASMTLEKGKADKKFLSETEGFSEAGHSLGQF